MDELIKYGGGLPENTMAKPLTVEDIPLQNPEFTNKYQLACQHAAISSYGLWCFQHDGKLYVVANDKAEGTAIYGGVSSEDYPNIAAAFPENETNYSNDA